MTALVGLSGYARSGKDEAAKALVAGGWERRAIADKLRRFLEELNPYVKNHGPLSDVVATYGWDGAKVRLPEVRSLLQRVGTEAGRKVLGDDVWISALLADIGERPVVVTDVRYPNEALAIQALGGIVVRVSRNDVGPVRSTNGSVHPSEVGLDGFAFDAFLGNNGTIDDLHSAIRRLVLVAAGV